MSNTALTLSEAAKTVGRSKAAVLQAIKGGRLSAVMDERKRWQIEPVELFRVWQPKQQPLDDITDSKQKQTANVTDDIDRLWRERLETLERLHERELAAMRETVDDLRTRLTIEGDERRRLMMMLADMSPKTEQSANAGGLFGKLFGK